MSLYRKLESLLKIAQRFNAGSLINKKMESLQGRQNYSFDLRRHIPGLRFFRP